MATKTKRLLIDLGYELRYIRQTVRAKNMMPYDLCKAVESSATKALEMIKDYRKEEIDV